jgi:iron(III) transport system ATP-binding protein
MNEGRIQQIGTPREIYEGPANQFVADFVGNTNFIDGSIKAGGAGLSRLVGTDIGDIRVHSTQEFDAGERVAVSVRPEDVDLCDNRPAGDNVWEGRVEQKVFLGEAVDFQVTVGPRTLLSRRHPTLRTKVGEAIFVHLDPEKCVVLKVG